MASESTLDEASPNAPSICDRCSSLWLRDAGTRAPRRACGESSGPQLAGAPPASRRTPRMRNATPSSTPNAPGMSCWAGCGGDSAGACRGRAKQRQSPPTGSSAGGLPSCGPSVSCIATSSKSGMPRAHHVRLPPRRSSTCRRLRGRSNPPRASRTSPTRTSQRGTPNRSHRQPRQRFSRTSWRGSTRKVQIAERLAHHLST